MSSSGRWTTGGRGEGMTFVTAFRARRGRERLRRDREARRASGSRLGGSRAAHDVATHTSDQIPARIPSPREGSQYTMQSPAPAHSALIPQEVAKIPAGTP